MITKRQWLKAARAFEKAIPQTSAERMDNFTRFGICFYLDPYGGVPYELLARFMSGCGLLRGHLMPPHSSHEWTPESDEVRALLCCFFAAMTPAERREVFSEPPGE